MNRQARRAAASKRRPNTGMRVEAYRVPPGRVGLTFDFAARDPSSISIDAAALADVLDRVGKLVAGKSYQQVLHLLAAVIQEADEGVADAWNGAILGFWLAVNHPTAGAEMADRLSDAIAIDGRAHITMHAGRPRGVAFALSDRFVDLDHAAHLAREVGLAAFVLGEPRRQRPGGRA
jgi:hypothetical protein